jgi:hypothetical protein
VRANEILHHKIGRSWGLNTRILDFHGQRDADSIEVKFIQSVFDLNDELCISKAWIWLNLWPPNGIEGLSRSVSSIWKVKDHGFRDMAWKLDVILIF